MIKIKFKQLVWLPILVTALIHTVPLNALASVSTSSVIIPVYNYNNAITAAGYYVNYAGNYETLDNCNTAQIYINAVRESTSAKQSLQTRGCLKIT